MLRLEWVDSAQEPRWLFQVQDSCCGLSAQLKSAPPWSFESKWGRKIWRSHLFSTKTHGKNIFYMLIWLVFDRLAVSPCQNIPVYVFSFLSTVLHFVLNLLFTSVGGVECEEWECVAVGLDTPVVQMTGYAICEVTCIRPFAHTLNYFSDAEWARDQNKSHFNIFDFSEFYICTWTISCLLSN